MTHLTRTLALAALAVALVACGVRGPLVPPQGSPETGRSEDQAPRFPAPVPVE